MQSGNRKRTRIQTENEQKIISAALTVFASFGFRGSTVDQIADACGMSKANVLYYFKRKNDIYIAVLEDILQSWSNLLTELDPNGDPLKEIRRYVRAKLEYSRTAPEASKLFANEVLQGAPMIRSYLEVEVKEAVDSQIATIEQWMEAGLIKKFEPIHLLFMIWSSTQHYCDFAAQIEALGPVPENKMYEDADNFLNTVLLEGLKGPNYREPG